MIAPCLATGLAGIGRLMTGINGMVACMWSERTRPELRGLCACVRCGLPAYRLTRQYLPGVIRQDNFHPAIHLPVLGAVVGGDRIRLTVTMGDHPLATNTQSL